MSFVRSLFNPTANWQEDTSLDLVVDLSRNSLSGVIIGDCADKLAFLGPAIVTSYGLAWSSKGIDAAISDGCIQELGFSFGHPVEPGKGTFAGRFQYHGQLAPLSLPSSRSDVLSVFGEYYWADHDDEETIFFYEPSHGEWQFEFALDGFLKHLSVGVPLLADPEQRLAYSVTRPWPHGDRSRPTTRR